MSEQAQQDTADLNAPPANQDGGNQGEANQGDAGKQQTQLIANKYKDVDAFDSAFSQLAKHEKVNLPGLAAAKFDDLDQKIELYKGLESLLHRGAPKADGLNLNPGEQQAQQDQQQQDAQPPKPMSMQDLVAGVGLEQEKINQAVMQGQDLSDDMLGKFAQAKITLPDGTTGTLSPELVKQVLGAQSMAAQSQQQAQQQVMQAAAQHVGGEDKLNALLDFGRNTLADATKKAIDTELADPSTRNAALDRLNQLYAQHVGAGRSNGIVSDTSGTGGTLANKPFRNGAERRAFAKEHGLDSPVYQSRLEATPEDNLNKLT